ncbi:aminotransferase class I/II-fold pyridoxal phosphate-dependent enzyme [Clostridium sp. CCUG 7971]|uniref:aminotransferase class I/II-fold pyridoxal phosphate-dependent enzyme n=1 Tax=Clostridium sp. CCUG 7971 TaxID=2811414 RepID=UPI001ABA5AB0|nr:aminotransferase class I/II-fold pyridoxal phosphate-dependent enzyme [Clostridium sp. CCUG 7971]MBO3443679.1 aminotransferase class I/II-fold pyridoxal phosphate-dependent enzyme [Clostridium sp. CCUG 7971]
MAFLDSLVSDRLGGSSFFTGNKKLYKFEKIKKLTKEAKLSNPNINLIDMSVGEPDRMADESIVDILNFEARKPENRYYADNGIVEFQESACRYMHNVYNIDGLISDNIMHGIGSKSILSILPMCFINPGDISLVPVPSYPTLASYTRFLGGEVYTLPLCEFNDFYPVLEDIPCDVLKRTKMLYLNYPNNPTGQVATYEFYKYVVDFAKKNNILIVCDAAYGNLVYDNYKPFSIFSVDGAMDTCVEIHSLSKSFNMTGWRLAFLVGNKKVIKLYSTMKSHADSGQFRAIQLAGAYALDNYNLVDTNVIRYSRRLDLLVKALREVGFDAKKPKGGFYVYVPMPKGVKNGIIFENADDASLYILSTALVSTISWDDCGGFLRFSATFDADTVEDEIKVIDELKRRLISLNLEF